jgi:hypothetical protein
LATEKTGKSLKHPPDQGEVKMKLASTHKLSRPLVVAALILASSGTAIAAESVSRGDKLIAKPNATNAVGSDVGRAAFGKPRRPDGSLLPHLGR